MRIHVFALLAAVFWLAACSGPAGPNGPVDPPPPPPTAHPDYETFDPSGYDAEPRRPVETVVHDVPDRLMEGRVDFPEEVRETVRTVDGFRIQIFSGEDRYVAEEVLAEARDWWDAQQGVPDELQPEVAYIQPYYRVRLGAFEFRQAADSMLSRVRRQYPDAFLVPDLVTIRN